MSSSSVSGMQQAMKFEEFLMETSEVEQQYRRRALEDEVLKLKAELDEEQALNKALKAAHQAPIISQTRFPILLLHPQVQEIVEELATVESEILRLDKKIKDLKLELYQERREYEERQIEISHHHHLRPQRRLSQHNHVGYESGNGLSFKEDLHQRSRSQNYEGYIKERIQSNPVRISLGSTTEFLSMTSTNFMDEVHELSRMHASSMRHRFQNIEEKKDRDPNGTSEQLIRCLRDMFLELNKVSQAKNQSAALPKRTSFSHRANLYTSYQNALNLDPYEILPDSSCTIRDIGSYKNFIHITKDSVDFSCFRRYSGADSRLRILLEKLSEVDLSFLSYKQKLAFWINIYNACIMHAFIEQGLPSSQDELLDLMNKASINVGGIVLNALAIEHFILRHPSEPENGLLDEKEALLRHAYGLGYSEPNVTFALCRGTWSSPALRVYTSEEVVNDLGKARVEYLEASVGVSNKRKLLVPKLLHWHMKDFADDMESLIEWIHSQLPRSGSLKGIVMECLNKKTRTPLAKMIQIQPYRYEFRYLFSV